MQTKTILVTGANGQLGRSIQQLVLEQQWEGYSFVFSSRSDLDLLDLNSIKQYFANNRISACINCAAYTAVDKAESEQEMAYQVNAHAVEALAASCKQSEAKFIHISTDYVFDGQSSVPYKEEQPTAPKSVYGSSKLEGERLALAINPETLIIRTAWVYSPYGNNFVKTMMRLMKDRDSLSVVGDQHGSPTYALDLAQTILEVLKNKPQLSGIYHYSNEGETTWFEFAKAIALKGNYSVDLSSISTQEYPTPAKRPKYSLLSKEKLKSDLEIEIPHWMDSLSHFFEHSDRIE